MMLFILLLACLAGFSARRGSMCLVSATSEILSKKPYKTFWFILEAMIIALAITVPATLLFPAHIHLAHSYPISLIFVIGAFIYGFGAGVNDACALGSFNQLINGNLNFMGTIFGIATGYWGYLLMFSLSSANPTNFAIEVRQFLIPILLLSWSFFTYRALKFFKLKEERITRQLHHFVNTSIARDFLAIACLGFASGLLYLILGHSWDYTSWITHTEKLFIKHTAEPDSKFYILCLTVTGFVLGVLLATKLSKSFKLIAVNSKEFSIKFTGGMFMGCGVGLIPGGNDTMILYGLPGLALHAPIAIIIMMSGAAVFIAINMFRD